MKMETNNCKICNRTFKTQQGLHIHIKLKHKIGVEQYFNKYLKENYKRICPVCGKQFYDFKASPFSPKKCCSVKCIIIDFYGKEKAKPFLPFIETLINQ